MGLRLRGKIDMCCERSGLIMKSSLVLLRDMTFDMCHMTLSYVT